MILVTGGTGFLGSELIRQLLNNGEEVRAIKRDHSSIPPILEHVQGLQWVKGDILDYFSLQDAFEGVKRVYHCAGLISLEPSDYKELLKVNTEGTANIVNLCMENQIEKLVHVSSIVALGDAKNGDLITEKDHWNGDQQYGYALSKYEAEMEVWRGIVEGINAVIVNPSIIIGKNAGLEGSGQLFALVRRNLGYYAPGSCGFVDVEDVATAMIMLMNSTIKGERFIVNGENLSYQSLFDQTARQFGLTPPTKKIRPWMLSIAWRAARLLTLITGRRYGLNRQTSANSLAVQQYSNEKIIRSIGIKFKPISQSIAEICSALN